MEQTPAVSTEDLSNASFKELDIARESAFHVGDTERLKAIYYEAMRRDKELYDTSETGIWHYLAQDCQRDIDDIKLVHIE